MRPGRGRAHSAHLDDMTTRTAPAPDDLFGYDDDRKVANETKATEKGLEPCTHCGREVKPGSGFLVTIVDGGASVLHPDDYSEEVAGDPGFMGSWVLGSTCAKSVPAEFRVKWNGWPED